MSLALKCGACPEYGRERVSTRTSMLCSFKRPTNFFAEWLECPIVKTDPRPEALRLPVTDSLSTADRRWLIPFRPGERLVVPHQQLGFLLQHVLRNLGDVKDNSVIALSPDHFSKRLCL